MTIIQNQVMKTILLFYFSSIDNFRCWNWVHCASRRQPCARRHGVLVSFLAKGAFACQFVRNAPTWCTTWSLPSNPPSSVLTRIVFAYCDRWFSTSDVQLIGKFYDFMHHVITPCCLNLFLQFFSVNIS